MLKWFAIACAVGTVVAMPRSSSAKTADVIAIGDFELGNIGFQSDYLFVAYNTWEGQYGIAEDPHDFNRNFHLNIVDHTSGAGKMMAVNGSPQAEVVVWSQTIPVVEDSPYLLSAWVRTLYPTSVARLQFSVNGAQVGSVFSPPRSTTSWAQFSTTWNSTADGLATIEIVNLNTDWSGNDFALDDISFVGEAVPEPTAVLLCAVLGCAVLLSPELARSRSNRGREHRQCSGTTR